MKVTKKNRQGIVVHELAKQSNHPASGVTLVDTSDVGVNKSSLHFRTLRNGKIIPLVSDTDPDHPRTNDSLQITTDLEVDFSVTHSESISVERLPSCEVVLEDSLFSIQNEKSKLLNDIPSFHHLSQQIEDE